jgi:predicted kinase
LRVVVLVGLPGSGKSTYIERQGASALSSDAIRKLLADDETDQTLNDRVFQTLRYLLRQRLELRRPVTYVDATNLTPQERAPYIGMAKSYGFDAEAVYFDVPLEICRERYSRRSRVVSEEAMQKLAARLIPPTAGEGFARILVVRDVEPGP